MPRKKRARLLTTSKRDQSAAPAPARQIVIGQDEEPTSWNAQMLHEFRQCLATTLTPAWDHSRNDVLQFAVHELAAFDMSEYLETLTMSMQSTHGAAMDELRKAQQLYDKQQAKVTELEKQLEAQTTLRTLLRDVLTHTLVETTDLPADTLQEKTDDELVVLLEAMVQREGEELPASGEVADL
eukprot:m.489272 g.489272  ORF g.489272 m.489272 type:complete len:183 (-) comp26545_c0_seq1:175-723(-)